MRQDRFSGQRRSNREPAGYRSARLAMRVWQRNCEAFSSSSDRTTCYSCPGGVIAALTPPVRLMASADLTGFAGSGEVATALLTKRPCTGLGVISTIAPLGLPA